jgi:Tfp pilus assembly protein PilX
MSELKSKLEAANAALADGEHELKEAYTVLENSIAAQQEYQERLATIRPPMTATQAAKDWIASQARDAAAR